MEQRAACDLKTKETLKHFLGHLAFHSVAWGVCGRRGALQQVGDCMDALTPATGAWYLPPPNNQVAESISEAFTLAPLCHHVVISGE